jgi:polynucleotide 5'-kinase involved in rRNA processing
MDPYPEETETAAKTPEPSDEAERVSTDPESTPTPKPLEDGESGAKTAASENDVRVAVIGNVDSGKSTLVGVLSKGEKDDGRGSARAKVFNYSHEAENG